MIEFESTYNTPSYGKDKEYCECEYCSGDGWVEHFYDGSASQQALTCPKCNGSGELEIEQD